MTKQFIDAIDQLINRLETTNEVSFDIPYIGCKNEEIISYVKDKTGKEITLKNGYFAFTLVATCE